MNCDYWRRLDISPGQTSCMKTGVTKRRALKRCALLGVMLAGLFSGCAHGMRPPSLPSLFSGNSISGQYEPDVDYEAEAAAREQQKNEDGSVTK